jgi:hypothetical protein
MENSYHQIIEQITKNERSKHYNLFLHDAGEEQQIYNNQKFLQIYNLLKDKYQVVFRLFGEDNFKYLAYEYFKFNPVQSAKLQNYGQSFSELLGTLDQLSQYKYLQWIAKLDWFWFNPVHEGDRIDLPVGTLQSWASIYKDQPEVDIQIDESITETLQIQKIGKETQIVAI